MKILKIRESAENYLETILILSYKNPVVRSIDIANELEYSKPSVSVAMKNLRENGYVRMDTDMYITLTDKGQAIAEKMYERHVFISNWLMSLGVDRTVAIKDACRMEHVISDETFNAMKSNTHLGTLVSIL
jgi:Mn-dependent DtxR family transcriptional regulator